MKTSKSLQLGKKTAELFLILSLLNAPSISFVQTASTSKSFLLTISILSVPFLLSSGGRKSLRRFAQEGRDDLRGARKVLSQVLLGFIAPRKLISVLRDEVRLKEVWCGLSDEMINFLL